MRFIEFEGDISILQEGKVREDKTKPDIEQRDEYSAENFMILSIKNEVKVLTSVKNLASKNLRTFRPQSRKIRNCCCATTQNTI